MKKDNSAKEYFEKLKIAEKFCEGDVSLAKKMLSGEFQDLIAIKGRFKNDDENIFGLFLVFISHLSNQLIQHHTIVSQFSSVFQHKPFDNWLPFLHSLEKELESTEYDEEKTQILHNLLNRFIFDDQILIIKKWIDDNDIMAITSYFEDIISHVPDIYNAKVVLDFEHTTSMILHDELGYRR